MHVVSSVFISRSRVACYPIIATFPNIPASLERFPFDTGKYSIVRFLKSIWNDMETRRVFVDRAKQAVHHMGTFPK
jgi:hypothetical protein